MAEGLTIDVSNQDYDIDVVLEGVVFFNAELVAGEGFIQAAGTPVANQIPVFVTPTIVRGYTNFVYDGTILTTPQLKVTSIAENGLDLGITFNDQVHLDDQKNIGANNIIGFGGYGYEFKYTGGKASLELDNLVVRGRMAVYELVIQKISHIGGALFITAGNGEVERFTGTGPYNLYFDTKQGANPLMFEIGDYVLAQRWTGSGVDQFEGQVTAVEQGSEYVTVAATNGVPWVGMELIQFGHPTMADRQNAILLKATDPVNPNNPVIVGYTGIDDGVFAGHMKFQLGNLAGITDPLFGTLTGFGLFADNVYLKGKIQIASGSTGFANLGDAPTIPTNTNQLTDGANLGGTAAWAGLSNKPGYIGAPTGSGLFIDGTHLGYYDSGAWKTYMDSGGDLVLGDPGMTGNGLFWDQSAGTLNIKGSIYITGGTTVPTNTNQLTDGAGLGTTATWSLVSGTGKPTDYADVTGNNTAYDTARVNGTAASTVQSGAAKANAGLDGSGVVTSKVMPTMAAAPSGTGLYLGSDYMGYYQSGVGWRSYIDHDGNCAFAGVGSFGTSPGGSGGVMIADNDIWENSINGYSNLDINAYGYNGGHSQYRGFYVYDGKGNVNANLMFSCTPSAGVWSVNFGAAGYTETKLAVMVYGPLFAQNGLSVQSSTFSVTNLTGGVDAVLITGGNIKLGNTPSYYTKIDNQVSVGPYAPNSFACLDLEYGRRQSGALGALIVPCLTQTEINALTARAGMVVYNTTDGHFYGYSNAWYALM